jgi:hypothetical protein
MKSLVSSLKLRQSIGNATGKVFKIVVNEETVYFRAYCEMKSEIADEAPNYFDLRENRVSFKMGIQESNESGRWIREGRQEMKLSKFINEYCDIQVDSESSDPEVIARGRARALEILSASATEICFDLMISDKPSSIYIMRESGKINTGSLGSSCMRHMAPKHFEIYDNNCKILYSVDDEGGLIGRALLWVDAIKDNGDRFKYVDRIYGSDQFVEFVKNWAEENGYFHKCYQTYDDATLTDGTSYIDKFSFSCKVKSNVKYAVYPYLDTLKWISKNKLFSFKNERVERKADCTGGGYSQVYQRRVS